MCTESGFTPLLEAMTHVEPTATPVTIAWVLVFGTGWYDASFATVAMDDPPLHIASVTEFERGVRSSSTTEAVNWAVLPWAMVSEAKLAMTCVGAPAPAAVGSLWHAATPVNTATTPIR